MQAHRMTICQTMQASHDGKKAKSDAPARDLQVMSLSGAWQLALQQDPMQCVGVQAHLGPRATQQPMGNLLAMVLLEPQLKAGSMKLTYDL